MTMEKAYLTDPPPRDLAPPVRVDPIEGGVRKDDLARFAAWHRKQALFEVARIVGVLAPVPEVEEPTRCPIDRYHFDVWGNFAVPREDNLGEWVKWRDVKKLLKRG